MKSQHYVTTQAQNYVSDGNLALAPSKKPTFTVIEGGLSHSDVLKRQQERMERREKRAAEQEYRARLIFISVVFAAVLLFGVICSNVIFQASRARSFSQVDTTEVTVFAGDSLWSIAEDHPVRNCSTQDVVTWIINENDLSSSMLVTGQRLTVPCNA